MLSLAINRIFLGRNSEHKAAVLTMPKVEKTISGFSTFNKYKSLKKDNKNKVSSYLIKEKKMFFFNDFSKSYSKEISFNEEFTKTYQKFLPDMIIVIPTKFDVYCNFINNVPCNESNYVEKLASIELIKDINIIDSSSFLIKKALFELENNKFLYDFKDTHLNSLGNMYLADFFAEVVNKN